MGLLLLLYQVGDDDGRYDIIEVTSPERWIPQNNRQQSDATSDTSILEVPSFADSNIQTPIIAATVQAQSVDDNDEDDDDGEADDEDDDVRVIFHTSNLSDSSTDEDDDHETRTTAVFPAPRQLAPNMAILSDTGAEPSVVRVPTRLHPPTDDVDDDDDDSIVHLPVIARLRPQNAHGGPMDHRAPPPLYTRNNAQTPRS